MDHENEILALQRKVTALEDALKNQMAVIKMLATEAPVHKNNIGCLNHLVGALIAEMARQKPDPINGAEEIICFHEANIFHALGMQKPGKPGVEADNRMSEEHLATIFGFARDTAKVIAAMS